MSKGSWLSAIQDPRCRPGREAARKIAAAAAAAANKEQFLLGWFELRVADRMRPELPQQNAGSGKQQAVVACYSTPSPGQNWCAAWVPMSSITPALATLEAMRATCLTPGAIGSDRSALQVGHDH